MKKSIYRKLFISILTILLICNMTGCMLLPKEEETRRISYVKSDELAEYSFTKPKRMDLEKVLNIACSYKQLEEETLSFNKSGQLVTGVFVSSGQMVQKGTLLATLQTDEISNEITTLQNQIKISEESIDQIKLKAEYDKKYAKLDYKYKRITKVEYDKAIADIEETLKTNTKEITDDIYIKKMRLELKNKEYEDSRIIAPIDGMISFVLQDLQDSVTREGTGVIKMIDPEKCAFEIYKVKESVFLQAGQTYKVDCKGTIYEGVLQETDSEQGGYLYLKLNEVPSGLVVGDSGTITYQAGSRKNALVLPSKVVHDGGDFKFVYMLDDNNVKVYHKVEIGLQTVEFTEILSGLDEHDKVIQE